MMMEGRFQALMAVLMPCHGNCRAQVPARNSDAGGSALVAVHCTLLQWVQPSYWARISARSSLSGSASRFCVQGDAAFASALSSRRSRAFCTAQCLQTAIDKLQRLQGLAPFGHLADGRLHLVIVRKCSRLQFLHFLATIPSQGAATTSSAWMPDCAALLHHAMMAQVKRREGGGKGGTAAPCQQHRVAILVVQPHWAAPPVHAVEATALAVAFGMTGCLSSAEAGCFVAGVELGRFPYVDIVEATAVAVEPLGKESHWNVDGELLSDNRLSAQARRSDPALSCGKECRGPDDVAQPGVSAACRAGFTATSVAHGHGSACMTGFKQIGGA